jgi:hypothetical protein
MATSLPARARSRAPDQHQVGRHPSRTDASSRRARPFGMLWELAARRPDQVLASRVSGDVEPGNVDGSPPLGSPSTIASSGLLTPSGPRPSTCE